MIYRTVLSVVGSVFGAELVFQFWSIAQSNAKATGLAAILGQGLESSLSPLFWVLAIALFALFFYASRLKNVPLRILLFWTPVTAISIVGFSLVTLFTYLWFQIRRG